jgi:hypothetical protein
MTDVSELGPKPSGSNIAELRSWQANGLRTIMGSSGLTIPEDLELDASVEHDKRFEHEYGDLAERLYSSFVTKAKETGDKGLIKFATQPNVLNGCYVLTRLLSYGPAAYADYLRSNPTHEGSLDELGLIMKRSSHTTLKLFADLDKQSSNTFEINFGLRQFPPPYERTPFVVEPDENDQLAFLATPSTLLRTKSEVIGRRLDGDMPSERNPDERCPAIGRVLAAIWYAGIEECMRDPDLFQASLDAAMEEIRMQLVRLDDETVLIDIEPPLDERRKDLLREDIIISEVPEEALVFHKRIPDGGDPFTEINCREVREGLEQERLELDEVNFAKRIAGVLEASGDVVRFKPDVKPIEQRGYLFLTHSTVSPVS